MTLRFRGSASAVHWDQIIPDISHDYKNANHPWEEDPYPARNRCKDAPNTKDYDVAMLVDRWPCVASFEIESGQPAKAVEWGVGVKRGDSIAESVSHESGHFGEEVFQCF